MGLSGRRESNPRSKYVDVASGELDTLHQCCRGTDEPILRR